jgi:hypothetical protein
MLGDVIQGAARPEELKITEAAEQQRRESDDGGADQTETWDERRRADDEEKSETNDEHTTADQGTPLKTKKSDWEGYQPCNGGSCAGDG